MTEIDVRGITDNDHAACMDVAQQLRGTYFNDKGIEGLKRALLTQEGLVAVAGDDETYLGFVTFVVRDREVAELTWLAVAPSFQGEGIGTALVEAVEQALGEQVAVLEVKTLAPTVDYPPYKRTRRFYSKLGFVLREILDPYPAWGEGNPAAIYAKTLEG